MRKILFISLLVYLLFTGNTIALSQPKTPPALTHYKDSPPTSPTTTTLETLGQCYRHDVSSLSEQEDDSSRRLFMTGVISVGILAGMGKANAIMMDDFDKQPQQKDPLSSFIESTSTFTADAATDAAAAAAVAAPVEWRAILQKASKKALGGGKAGASAAVVQVCSLMWLRTSMNYQVSTKSFFFLSTEPFKYRLKMEEIAPSNSLLWHFVAHSSYFLTQVSVRWQFEIKSKNSLRGGRHSSLVSGASLCVNPRAHDEVWRHGS